MLPFSGWAINVQQPIAIPEVVKFADIRLRLSRGARKRVQEKVDRLTRAKRLFNQILDRTNLFFPLIEKTLAEENVPQDFKFQALHESMLIGNAVSHTHDVGFWQIHKVAALDLKLSIDHPVDERMHLIQSTKAAARFLKSHNQYFDSWLAALLAYNRGRAGVVKMFPKKYYGVKVVPLCDKTDDYIISVVATKLAFEKMAGKKKHSELQLFVYDQGHHGHKLQDIALHLKIEEKLLSDYNQWLRTSVIPHNTNCSLVVPFLHTHSNGPKTSMLKLPKPLKTVLPERKKIVAVEKGNRMASCHSLDYNKYLAVSKKFPEVSTLKDSRSIRLIKANGKLAIIAQEGDTIAHLANIANLRVDKFLLINDISEMHHPIPNRIYYYSAKGSKGGVHYHVVAPGEAVWDIAQQYGIKQSALLEKNRMQKADPLEEGQILWLRFIRPHTIPVEYK
ncbi:LysM peptidoglycan-binding domain-containing protein [Candidatus Cardinium hertigii]|jgi:membrane-bound lytic murein transglycosylase D|nr:transglycosylase SLT domain-containing protein [Candidatus Cardinium hertigii]